MPQPHDITHEDQHAIIQHMTKVHPEAINRGLFHLVSNKIISPMEAKGVLDKIGKAKEDNQKNAFKEAAKPPEEKKDTISQPNANATKEDKPKQDQTITQAEDRITPKSSKIEPTDDLKTLNYGNLIGKQETTKAKTDVKNAIVQGRTKIGGTGETFDSFLKRGIKPLKKALKESPDNTILVTHSSMAKAYNTWDGMGRPDVDKMSKEQKQKFADKYNEDEVPNGDVQEFKSDHGKLFVVRHGETEDNKKNVFRNPDTQLTDKGIKQAQQAGEEIKGKVGDEDPNIITSSMPRAVHTANIIHQVLQGNKGIDFGKVADAADPEEIEKVKANPTQSGINDFLDHLQKNRAIKRG